MSPQTPTTNAALIGRLEASIMAESALIDKETGRVYWEGGSSSTLSASLIPKVGELGLSHLKCTVLTSLLLLALVSFLALWIRQCLDNSSTLKGDQTVSAAPQPLYKAIPMFLLQWTLLKTPKFDGTFVLCVFLLYLLEAHTSSTRRFLANAITSPDEVEDYIENLRSEGPVVTWKVRCFHYEKPFWLSPIRTSQNLWSKFVAKIQKSVPEGGNPPEPSDYIVPREIDNVSGLLKRKVVSHQATSNYTFNSFIDDTMAGVWKRQISTSSKPAPFMKIVLSKILVLANSDARDSYFKQQSRFVTSEGMRDKYAEYTTNIEVPGFKRRMLAIRPVEGAPSSKLFRLNTFWLFTLLGMSLPYRIWFSRHCEQLRVTVVKETYAEPVPKSTFSSWFTAKSATQAPSSNTTSEAAFRQQMQSMLLYAQKVDVSPQVEKNISMDFLNNNTTPSRDQGVSSITDTQNMIELNGDASASKDINTPEPKPGVQAGTVQEVRQGDMPAISEIHSSSGQPVDENSISKEDDNATISDSPKKSGEPTELAKDDLKSKEGQDNI